MIRFGRIFRKESLLLKCRGGMRGKRKVKQFSLLRILVEVYLSRSLKMHRYLTLAP